MFLDLNVGQLVEPLNGRHWDRPTIAREIATRVERYRACGLQPRDRVLLFFGNRLEFFAELLAIWRLGACAVPVDSRLTEFEVSNLVDAAAPRFFVVDDASDTNIVDAIAKKGTQVLNALEVDAPAGTTSPSLRPTPPGTLDDDALILFTSGTTGNPKGVVHTHRSLRARWITLRQSLGLEPFRRTLCLLPTHFGHGLICNCLFPWLSGQDLYICPPFQPQLIMRLGTLVDEHEITFMSSVPSVWRLALKTAKPPTRGTLKQVHCGSAPLSAYLWQEIQKWTSTRRVLNAYGITETGSWVAGTTTAGNEDITPADGLVGEPWGAVVKILRTKSTALPLTPDLTCDTDETGYVWLNTPALMKGYYLQDDLTAEVVCQGWFMTGDIGCLDHHGRLYLKGREREEINKGGMKVFPADIDSVAEQFTGTQDVCTFGFEDPLYGQNVGIAVVLSDERDETVRELYAWIHDRLAEHKAPVRWYRVDSIPRTSRGKINRDTVMQECAQAEPLDLRRILSSSSQGDTPP